MYLTIIKIQFRPPTRIYWAVCDEKKKKTLEMNSRVWNCQKMLQVKCFVHFSLCYFDNDIKFIYVCLLSIRFFFFFFYWNLKQQNEIESTHANHNGIRTRVFISKNINYTEAHTFNTTHKNERKPTKKIKKQNFFSIEMHRKQRQDCLIEECRWQTKTVKKK